MIFLYVIIIIFILCILYHYTALVIQAKKYPPPGELVSVNGHKLHIFGEGKGSPTIIFDSGHGLPAYTNWSLIQPEISKTSRTCIYDRAGYGWSEGSSKPRTSAQMVEELHTLLITSGEKAPFILVAHSISALNACLFAHTYPSEVAGLVIVDGGTPQFYKQLNRKPLLRIMRIAKYLSILGLIRVLGQFRLISSLNLVQQHLSREYRKLDKALFYRHFLNDNMLNELISLGESTEQVSAIDTLGDIPLVIITSGQNAANIKNWQAGHLSILELSTDKTHIIAEGIGHSVHLEQPETVIREIRKLLDSLSK
ncbi:alpha/beta fold hydrolase [Paenibacillus antarcticus]|uniref:AB hydrolase-1 domain-containing protein n=1 Tax=Paenibacillus antarcticus TaxID=253703 RepID=A0A162MA54_9BACL|nr:alpha/beta hydrolase [Paenibacillus antarcticus]OAB40873.1 hypothetical protein PBAT_22390 [Paenibacillus antarcticus]OAB40934.1 hypothetical protein PBAT_22365 [Paenibacillus antarcticus]